MQKGKGKRDKGKGRDVMGCDGMGEGIPTSGGTGKGKGKKGDT